MVERLTGPDDAFYPTPPELLVYPEAPDREPTQPEFDMMTWVKKLGEEGDVEGLSELAQGRLTEGQRQLLIDNEWAGGDNGWLLGWAVVEAVRLRDEIRRPHALVPPADIVGAITLAQPPERKDES